MTRIVYVHIHKNAGNTFYSVLWKIYGRRLIKDKSQGRNVIGKFLNPKYESRRGVMKIDPNGVHRRYRLIGGHFYSKRYSHLKDDGWKFVTWIREPVDRIISHYDHFKRWNATSKAHKRNQTMLKYFENPKFSIMEFSKMFPNYQTRFVGDIELFDFVGIVERFDEDYIKFCDMFGHKRVDYEIKNVNPIKRTVVSKKQRQRMKSHHVKDYNLYHEALNR
jgi:hypothetical protein